MPPNRANPYGTHDIETNIETERANAPPPPPPPEAALDDSKHSKGTSSKRSILVPLDPSILQLVSTVQDEHCCDDSEQDEAEKHCCRRNYHLCCCCLCDLVKACSITNTIYFFVMIFLIVFVYNAERWGIGPSGYGTDSDENLQDHIDTMTDGIIVRNSIGMPMAIIGNVGAYKFNRWLVLCTLLWYCAYLVWAILGDRYFSAIFAGLLLYPNGALFLSLLNGKITSENYSSVKQCCSQNPRKRRENE